MLLDILPKEYVYKIEKSVVISDQQFQCELRCNVRNEQDFKKWLREFEYVTDTTWILRNSPSKENSHFFFSRSYICVYSSNSKKLGKKDKNCTASLTVRIKRNNRFTHYRDSLLGDGFCSLIKINFQHNHKVIVAETLKWPPKSEEKRDIFAEMFDSDITSSAAESEGHKPEVYASSQLNTISDTPRRSDNLYKTWGLSSRIISQFHEQMTKIATLVEESNDNDILTLMEHFTEGAANVITVADLCAFLHPKEDCKKSVIGKL